MAVGDPVRARFLHRPQHAGPSHDVRTVRRATGPPRVGRILPGTRHLRVGRPPGGEPVNFQSRSVGRIKARISPAWSPPQRRFFGTSTYLSFFQPPWESRKVEHKQKGNDGGRPPTHPWVRVLTKSPRILGIHTLQPTRSRRLLSTLRCHRRATRTPAAPVPPIADRRSGQPVLAGSGWHVFLTQ